MPLGEVDPVQPKPLEFPANLRAKSSSSSLVATVGSVGKTLANTCGAKLDITRPSRDQSIRLAAVHGFDGSVEQVLGLGSANPSAPADAAAVIGADMDIGPAPIVGSGQGLVDEGRAAEDVQKAAADSGASLVGFAAADGVGTAGLAGVEVGALEVPCVNDGNGRINEAFEDTVAEDSGVHEVRGRCVGGGQELDLALEGVNDGLGVLLSSGEALGGSEGN